MLPGLEATLDECARHRTTLTYGQLAERLNIDAPRRIATLTTALEALMDHDARLGHPLRAALVVGRGTGGLPARGFFLKAHALGLFPGDAPDAIARDFHVSQLDGLYAAGRAECPDQ